jgi:FlaA1/EpsC-like NDP-sugar epimerase
VILLAALLAYGALALLRIHELGRDVVVLYIALCFTFSVALRISLTTFQRVLGNGVPAEACKRVAVFGVNRESEVFARLLKDYASLNVAPVLFIDYDTASSGMSIGGIPVRCCREGLSPFVAQFRIEAVILAAGALRSPALPTLKHDCRSAGLDLQIIDINLELLSESPSPAVALASNGMSRGHVSSAQLKPI